MKKTWIRIGIIFLLTLVFMYFFFRNVEWKEVYSLLNDVDLKFFLLSVLLIPLHLLTRAIRWDFLLKHEKKGISLFNRFAGNAVGFTVTLVFPGRLGEIVKPLYLAQKENMSKGFVIGTIVVERIFDIFTMCSILGLFLVTRPLYASLFQVDEDIVAKLKFWGIVGVALASSLLVLTLCLYFFKTKTIKFISFCLKPVPNRISDKILEIFEEFTHGLKFFHSIGNVLIYIGLSFMVWLGIIFYYWIFFMAYDVSIPYFFLFPYVFMVMVGASIPTPGMVGGFHYFSKLGLTSFYNIETNLAFGMTLVVHSFQVVVTCLIGYAILWKEGTSLFQIKKIGEVTDS